MGLYLCVFGAEDEELEGVEVGSYADFNFFRDSVIATVENDGALYPVLNGHSDCDGEWTADEAQRLITELQKIAEVLSRHPPVELNVEWKRQVSKSFGIRAKTLLDCFFDIDGEPLVERLVQLAQVSVDTGNPILFQ
jgi:hypothetical protein